MVDFKNWKSVQAYEKLWERYGDKNKVPKHKEERRSKELRLGKVHFTGEYLSGGEVLEFVPAFWDKYRSGEALRKSVGVMFEWHTWEEEIDPNNISLESPVEPSEEAIGSHKPMGPTGYKFKTDILRFQFPRGVIEEQLSDYQPLASNVLLQLMGFLYSFQATHALAVITELEVELGDIGYTWDITEDSLFSYVYDVFEGGSGVTKKVFMDWSGKEQTIRRKIKRLLYPPDDEKCCEHWCEKCILLPRTPEFLVRSGLLDKDHVRILFED